MSYLNIRIEEMKNLIDMQATLIEQLECEVQQQRKRMEVLAEELLRCTQELYHIKQHITGASGHQDQYRHIQEMEKALREQRKQLEDIRVKPPLDDYIRQMEGL
jgi:septal ring factor EnvC (AmiA/AmiB activator)